MFRIDIATESDIPRILEIEKESFSPPWTHGTLLGEVFREDSFFAVVLEDLRLLGFVILRCMGDSCELLQIAVDKTHRRLGAADMLIGAALGYATENTLNPIYLEVREGNTAAIALYEKHGFQSVRQRTDYYTDPVENALIMLREL
jgi:ribosomal-protein-alanine N-acetyltransferase